MIGRWGFRPITWILAFAFLLQSSIAQTHIHYASEHKNGALIVKSLAKGSTPAKAPSEKGNSSCPFCQAVTHAGVFSTPTVQNLLPLLAWAQFFTVSRVADSIGGVSSHPWHSRAPPLH